MARVQSLLKRERVRTGLEVEGLTWLERKRQLGTESDGGRREIWV